MSPVRQEPEPSLQSLIERIERLEKVGAFASTVSIAKRGVNQKIPNATFTVVKYDQAIFDPNAHMNVNGEYTVPATGAYLALASAAWAPAPVNTVLISSLFRGAGEWTRGRIGNVPVVNGEWSTQVASIVQANVGETLSHLVFQNGGAELELLTPFIQIAVVRVG